MTRRIARAARLDLWNAGEALLTVRGCRLEHARASVRAEEQRLTWQLTARLTVRRETCGLTFLRGWVAGSERRNGTAAKTRIARVVLRQHARAFDTREMRVAGGCAIAGVGAVGERTADRDLAAAAGAGAAHLDVCARSPHGHLRDAPAAGSRLRSDRREASTARALVPATARAVVRQGSILEGAAGIRKDRFVAVSAVGLTGREIERVGARSQSVRRERRAESVERGELREGLVGTNARGGTSVRLLEVGGIAPRDGLAVLRIEIDRCRANRLFREGRRDGRRLGRRGCLRRTAGRDADESECCGRPSERAPHAAKVPRGRTRVSPHRLVRVPAHVLVEGGRATM
jgi:hypothetical protein